MLLTGGADGRVRLFDTRSTRPAREASDDE